MLYRSLFLLISFLYVVAATSFGAGSAEDALTPDTAVWVHYTRFKPRGTHLVAGSVPVIDLGNAPSKEALAQRLARAEACLQLRHTVHGVLNGRVASHEMAISQKKSVQLDRAGYDYAVMIPFSKLENVWDAHPQDTFVVGNVSLADATILVAHGADMPDVEVANVVQLTAGKAMFDAVEESLRAQNLPIVEFNWADQTVRITSQALFDKYFSNMTERQAALMNGSTLADIRRGIQSGMAQRMIQTNFEYALPFDQHRFRVNDGPLHDLSELMPACTARFDCWNHNTSVFGGVEKCVQKDIVLVAARQIGTMPERVAENRTVVQHISKFPTVVLQKYFADETEAMKALKTAVKARHAKGELTDAALASFNAFIKELNVWIAYLTKHEIGMREKGKSLFSGKGDEGVRAVRSHAERIWKTVQKMRADAAAPKDAEPKAEPAGNAASAAAAAASSANSGKKADDGDA